MEINELKKQKEFLESQINDMIEKFEKTTRVNVSTMCFYRKQVVPINESINEIKSTNTDNYVQPDVKIYLTL